MPRNGAVLLETWKLVAGLAREILETVDFTVPAGSPDEIDDDDDEPDPDVEQHYPDW